MSTEVQERPLRKLQAVAPSALPWWKLLTAALASSLLLWLCHFPVAWGWLGWVALVPLLFLVRINASKWRIFLASYLAGAAFFWPILTWMTVADYRMYATWAMLATYCSFYFPAAVGLVRYLDRRTSLPLIVTVPAVWTALEYARSFILTGFAWYYLGHTQHDVLPMIQIADLAGAYGVTFVLAAVNAWLFELLWSLPAVRRFFGREDEAPRPRLVLLQGMAVALLVVATLGYGYWRLGQNDFATGPRMALVQSNLDQRIRNDTSDDAPRTMYMHSGLLTSRAMRTEPPPDVIIWPETSLGYVWNEVSPELPADRLPPKWDQWVKETQHLAKIAAAWRTDILLGVNSEKLDATGQVRRYNTALLLRPDASVAGQYHKMHRVPFGEYVPFRDWLPWMNEFAPYDFDYSILPGDTFTRFPAAGRRFGVIICYEDTDPVLSRQYVADDPVDFLVNISNDGWFDGTSEHDEHLAICRFRAVECRRAVVRSVNMGISAVIDGNGRVREPERFLVGDDQEGAGPRRRPTGLALA